jgi:hypothetical protein
MRNLILHIALLAAFLTAAPAGAEIYHWVDDQGVPHYSNQKPPATDKTLSTQEEIPYDAEADRQRREAEAAAWKEELERESREEEARLKLEAERLAALRQQRASQAPDTIIQNNVYRSGGGGGGYYPPYCEDGLPPPCRGPILTPRERRQLYHRRYYQSSPYFRGHLYYGNTLNYRPGRPGAGMPPSGVYPPVGRPPVARPPVVRPPGVHPPVARPPIVGRPRPAPYR